MTDSEVVDVDKILNNTGFNAEKNLLTRRQAEVLALRQKGLRQLDIANLLGLPVPTSQTSNVVHKRISKKPLKQLILVLFLLLLCV